MKQRGWKTGYLFHRSRPDEVQPDLSMFDVIKHVADNDGERPREDFTAEMAEFANGFDVVHHSLIPLDWRFLFKMALKRPQVETYHSLNGWKHVWGQYRERLGAGIERLPDVVTAISGRLANAISRDLGCPVRTIYNGVDIPAQASTGGRYVTYSGRIAKDKGLDDWMRAALIIRDAVPDVKFQWLGALSPGADPFVFDALKAGCPWLEMPGFVEDIGPYYARTAVLMHLSPNEGLPMVIPEAMAYGAEAVAYDVGDTRESGAILVNSPEHAAAVAIDKLTQPEGLAWRTRQRETSARFSMETMGAAYLDIYESLGAAICT